MLYTETVAFTIPVTSADTEESKVDKKFDKMVENIRHRDSSLMAT